MSQIQALLSSLQAEDYPARAQILQYIQMNLKNPRFLSAEDRQAVLDFLYTQVEELLTVLPKTETYRRKDMLFGYFDTIISILTAATKPEDLPDGMVAKMELLIKRMDQDRGLERELDRICQQEVITAPEVQHLIFLAKQATDEYQKGQLFAGLHHYADAVMRMSPEAKAPMAAYMASELERLVQLDHPDRADVLELLVDVCQYFPSEGLVSLLHETAQLGYANVNYFLLFTLLNLKAPVPEDLIPGLANDLVYANLTHGRLKDMGMVHLFPEARRDEVYLAKSDLVHWLSYPTELGQAPEEIEYLGRAKPLFKKEIYHIFKFRSHSAALGEELQGKWLIGWSSNDGGTFSEFEELAQFEGATTEKTLKNLKKRIVGW